MPRDLLNTKWINETIILFDKSQNYKLPFFSITIMSSDK